MALSMFEIGIIILLIVGIGIMITSFIFSHNFQNQLLDKVMTKGMNGVSGQTINLTCPPQMVISYKNNNKNITRGAIIAIGEPTCDAFFQRGVGQNGSFFNPNTTVDALAPDSPYKDITSLEGQNKGSFTVPKPNDPNLPKGSCLASAAQLAFIGTYDCIKK